MSILRKNHSGTPAEPSIPTRPSSRGSIEGGIVFPLDKVWYSYAEAELLGPLHRHFAIEAVEYDPSIEPVYRDFPRIYSLVKR